MKIREATAAELPLLQDVNRAAFGAGEGPVVAGMVADTVGDPTARPVLSLVAVEDEGLVGHVLFSAASIGDDGPACRLLAPLAVVPGAQGKGVGTALVKCGLELLADAGVALVFLAGWPGYYSRFGFEPAGPHGLEAPQPIPAAHSDGWMVRALAPGVLGTCAGVVQCCDAIDKPELWGP